MAVYIGGQKQDLNDLARDVEERVLTRLKANGTLAKLLSEKEVTEDIDTDTDNLGRIEILIRVFRLLDDLIYGDFKALDVIGGILPCQVMVGRIEDDPGFPSFVFINECT